jgi:hypothetical protein
MAMRLPSPTLSIIRRGPNTQSPPAKTPGALVIRSGGRPRSGRAAKFPRRPPAVRKSSRGACPMARITVSHSMVDSLFSSNDGLNFPCASKTAFVRTVFKPHDFSVAAQHALGSRGRRADGRPRSPLPRFLRSRRHLVAPFQAYDADLARSQTQRRKRNVHHFMRRDRGDVFLDWVSAPSRSPPVLLQHFANAAERATSIATFPPPITTTFCRC